MASKQVKRLQKLIHDRPLSAHFARFHVSAKRAEALMADSYASLQAPKNIAPPSKSPFTRTGEMTAHHWVNFAKVHGKYLFAQLYAHDITIVQPLCRVLDIVELCLRSSVTRASKQLTDAKVAEMAGAFGASMPDSERSIVMHVLMFHMPATIRMWGPSRGFWCFPFERSGLRMRSTRADRHAGRDVQVVWMARRIACARAHPRGVCFRASSNILGRSAGRAQHDR